MYADAFVNSLAGLWSGGCFFMHFGRYIMHFGYLMYAFRLRICAFRAADGGGCARYGIL